jgi:uncharacterized protein
VIGAITLALALGLQAAPALPTLTAPVNDFAHIIDRDSAAQMDRLIRALQATTTDVVVVVTVPDVEAYGDINSYAVKLFENGGRGIGDKDKKNGLLILMALKERKVWIEVGYGLEQWITDGYAGETSREFMVPQFRQGRYGAGLLAGTQRVIGRIAQGRNTSIEGLRVPAAPSRRQTGTPLPVWATILIFIVIVILGRLGGGPGGPRFWGGGGFGGWSSGVGSFGGGGGFGGGFGGFGGGGSGGGGGGSSW